MSPRYLFKFVLHMFAFSVLLGISMIVADNSAITFPVKLLISLLPVIPFLIAIHTLFQHLKSLDEMHHRINQESVIYSLASVAIIAVILGVLEINEIILISLLFSSSCFINILGYHPDICNQAI